MLLTGRAPGQFDPATLAQLPREAPLVVADDPWLVRVLAAAGFNSVRVLPAATDATFGSLSVAVTPNGGVFFADGGATAWRLPASGRADAASIASRAARLDVALVPEPVDEALDAYAERLADVAESGAASLVALASWRPAASALRALPFPSPGLDHFARDLADLDPAWVGRVHPGRPGDVVRVEAGDVKHLPGASACCRLTESASEPPAPFARRRACAGDDTRRGWSRHRAPRAEGAAGGWSPTARFSSNGMDVGRSST